MFCVFGVDFFGKFLLFVPNGMEKLQMYFHNSSWSSYKILQAFYSMNSCYRLLVYVVY